MTEHEAAKPKKPRDIEFEDAPQKESIRGMSPRTIRRNPSSDQKKVRRQMQREATTEETELSGLLVEAAVESPFAEWTCATPGCEKYDGMSAFRGDKYCKSCMKAGEPDKQRGKSAALIGEVPEKKVLPGIGDNGEDLHVGQDWHDVQPGDKMVGLDGAVVKSITPSGAGHDVTFEHPEQGTWSEHRKGFFNDLALYRKASTLPVGSPSAAPTNEEEDLTAEAALPLPTDVETPERKPEVGDQKCQDCDYSGAPVLSQAGAPQCRSCGGYNINKVKIQQSAGEKNIWGTDKDHINADEYCPDCEHPNSYNADGSGPHYDSCPQHPKNRKTATVFDTQADRLNVGDQIRTPTGQTVKVLRMRNHETSPGHVYMDTDQGTSVVRRKAPVQVVPFNSQQQELPGYGTPGGNTNQLPMDKGNVGPSKRDQPGTNQAQSSNCPVCGGKGTMARKGQGYVCSKCGYRENVGAAGPGSGFTFTDTPQRLMGNPGPNKGPGFPVASSLKSAIARRAQEVLDSTEENQ